jgi:phage/plasmid primase-like uncharacterized protein
MSTPNGRAASGGERPRHPIFARVKAAARRRELELLARVGGFSDDVLDGKHHPCPSCGGEDRFRLIDESAGAVFCNQCFNARNGDFISAIAWRLDVAMLDAAQLCEDYLATNTAGPGAPPRTRTKLSSEELQAIARRAVETLAEHPEELQRLADDLGLPVEALQALPGLGLLHGPDGVRWTIPEVDASGTTVGLATRTPAGMKKSLQGSRRGLTVPAGFLDRMAVSGALSIVEGASDVAAADYSGLAVLGRPSVEGGVAELTELIQQNPKHFFRRRLIVWGENDRKEDGTWPGRDKALRAATELSKRTGRTVWFVLPPPSFNRSHSISEGKNTSRHLYQLMTRYLTEHLPAGQRP